MQNDALSDKAQWLKEHLKPGELYAGLVLGLNGQPDHHLVVAERHEALTFAAALERAQHNGGFLPTAREMVMVYLNLPHLFSDLRARYWTCERCPAPAYAYGAEAKREYVRTGNPGWLGAQDQHAAEVFRPQAIQSERNAPAKLPTLLVRRIALPAAGAVPAAESMVEQFARLDARLAELGFKPEYATRPLTGQLLEQSGTLHWVAQVEGTRFELTIIEDDEEAAGLSAPRWTGRLGWNVHCGEVGDAYSEHTGVRGEGRMTEEQMDAIVAALKTLLAQG